MFLQPLISIYYGNNGKKENKAGTKLIEIERSETGSVKLGVYLTYIKANGYFLTLMVLAFYAISNGLQVGSNVWLADWSNDNVKVTGNASSNVPSTASRLGGYAGFGIGQGKFT